MYNLLVIYDCSKCGKVLEDEVTFGEDIDTERDEIYEYAKCNHCNNPVTKREQKDADGNMQPCYEEVDEERARWAHGFYNDEVNNSQSTL